MIRTALVILLAAAVAVTALALSGDPGRASLVWLGWRLDTTAAAAVLMTLALALAAMILWRLVIWLAEAPRRAARARAETRRREAADALGRGFLAVAAGDGPEARRLAQSAAALAEDSPGLVRVLSAQAAEAAGDRTAAQSAYAAMLGFPEMRLAGHRGLMLMARDQGDQAAAADHAEQAFGLARTAPWAWRALLEVRLQAGDWDRALALTKQALDRKIVSPIIAERARAALLAAAAAGREGAADPKVRAQALDQASEAARLQPGFAPGVVMAARLLTAEGKANRAAAVLEQAWKTAPHPALWLAYRDLRVDETPAQRSARLGELAALNAGARESRILQVERALIAGDAAAARAAAGALEPEPVTARLAALFVRTARAGAAEDEARMWIARGHDAPQEPDWSDLDPEGRAFAYRRDDWARLVAAFVETGELIHPRLERREPVLGELPPPPAPALEAARFAAAAESVQALYSAPGDDFGEDEPPR